MLVISLRDLPGMLLPCGQFDEPGGEPDRWGGHLGCRGCAHCRVCGGGAVATVSCCVLSVEWAPLLGPWQDGTTC